MRISTSIRLILTVWIIVWAVFLARPFFKGALASDYSMLLKLSDEGKRAYVAGPKLYEFIRFCNQVIKKPSSYGVVGVEEDSLDHRRIRYYLYPNIEKAAPEFILVYGKRDHAQDGYKIFKILDLDRYILKKVK